MSKYTTEVRYICESLSGLDTSKGFNSVGEIIEGARTKIFDFDYPIYDDSYRRVLETKILKHFYTREIGAETYGLWKLWLDRKMNEIMPYYNQLYKSAMIEFNPIYDTDITTVHDKDNSGTNSAENTGHSEGTNTGDKNNWDYYSDTPQGGINGLESMTYLTNATHDTLHSTNNSETDSTGTTNGQYADTEKYIEHITGKRNGISYSKLIEEFRGIMLNIDVDIINELNDLFLNLW